MHMDIPFTEVRPSRVRSSRPVRRERSVLWTLIQHISNWIGVRLAVGRSVAELQAMDDRMLRDIGLGREEIEGLSRKASRC